jgi:hypothetical protein
MAKLASAADEITTLASGEVKKEHWARIGKERYSF